MSAPNITGVTNPGSVTLGQPFDVLVAASSTNPAVSVPFVATATSSTAEVATSPFTVQASEAITIELTSPDPSVVIEAGPGGPGDFTVTING